jgi:ketosteroid isomerase-like protein
VPTGLEVIRSVMGGEGERLAFDPARLRRNAEENWDPEIVYEEAPDWPGAGTFRGRDAILARLDEYVEVLGDMETEVEEIVPDGEDRALVIFRAYARSVAGVPVERRWGYLFTVRDSKLVHWRAEMDPDTARQDLELG